MIPGIDTEALDRLMPMHALLDRDGTILRIAPTLAHLADDRIQAGQSILDGIEVLRPSAIGAANVLSMGEARRLTIRFRNPPLAEMTGHLVPWDGGAYGVLNLSLSLRSLSGFGGTRLSAADFAPTDGTIDILYLLEARKLATAEVRRLIDRLEGARSRAERAAYTDTLTGLRNRRALDDVLQDVDDSGQPFAVCQVDLDYFKDVNDTHGHAAGDAVLRAVAERLCRAVRATDTVARVGGDEFTLVFPGLVDCGTLERIADRIVESLEAPVEVDGAMCRISASVGISLSTDYDAPDPERMVEDADRALYKSKSGGRARYTFHGQGCAT